MKRFVLLMIVLALLVLTFGCTKEPADSIDVNLIQVIGYIEEFSSTENFEQVFITLNSNGDKIKLEIKDRDLFESLEQSFKMEENNLYMVVYTDDMILESIESNPELKEQIESSADDEPELIIAPVEKVNIDDLTLLDEFTFDFDNDGIEEKIGMYTAAQKDPNGEEIVWDDGQQWMFIVQDSDKDYILVDEYVQIGRIDFNVFTIEDEFYITTLSPRTASITLNQYHYNKEDDSFIMTVPFNKAGNVNMLKSSYGY